MRCSKVFGAATFRTVNLEAMSASREVPEKCRAICADREEILKLLFKFVEVERCFSIKIEFVGDFWLASVNRLQELEKREELKQRV